MAAAVARPVTVGIPVVTLVTGLPHSARLAYVGIDDRAAGATAASRLVTRCNLPPGVSPMRFTG